MLAVGVSPREISKQKIQAAQRRHWNSGNGEPWRVCRAKCCLRTCWLRVLVNLAQNAIAREIGVKSTGTHSVSNEMLHEILSEAGLLLTAEVRAATFLFPVAH